MTHKKAVRYFKPRKKTPIKTTFRLMRVGFWRSIGFSGFAAYAKQRLNRTVLESIMRDRQFNSIEALKQWINFRAQAYTRRGAAPKLKLRCLFVGRGRATSQELFMTRHTFRRFLRLGLLPGFIKITKI